MHVLIIGGTRFVGYQLVWRLLATGQRVTLLNRGSLPDPWGNRVERLRADRTTPDFARVLAGRRFDAAVDFAAYTADDAIGAIGALHDVGHYVFISTGQVYLVRQDCPTPAREADYPGPVLAEPADAVDRDDWLYGVRKRAAEERLEAAWQEHGFPATRLRIPMVNGERDHFGRISSYLWRILDGGPVLLPDGGGHPTRHVYSGDVVRAITALLGKAQTFGQAYNLSQNETVSLAELVATLADLVGAPNRLEAVPWAELAAAGIPPAAISPFSDPWMSRLDNSKARSELGFAPEPLQSHLSKIVACWLNQPAPPPANYSHRPAELALARARH